MAKKKDRTGLVVFLVFGAVVLGVGGYFGWGWYRVSQERETWGGLVASLLPAFNEGLEQVSEVEPHTLALHQDIQGPVLVWSRNDNCVVHLPATDGRQATDPSGSFTVIMTYKKLENTGMYLLSSQHEGFTVQEGTAPARQYTLSVAVIDPREGGLLSAHKIFGSPPADLVEEVHKGLTGPDDVREKLDAWLRGSLR